MIINHNLMANNAIRQMNINSGNASKSMQKLSSGLRINNASDDAAGLAISEKMKGQIRGLDQASSNAQDGISMIQTGEGALNETQSILQRMRELAVQSSNDTNTGDDRTAIQTEMNQLTSEINRIGNTTEFNTQKLLNGGTATGAVGAVNTTTSGVAGTASAAEVLGTYTVTVGNTIASGNTFTVAGQTYTASAGDTASSVASGLASAIGSAYTTSVTGGVLTLTQKTGSGTATAPTASSTGGTATLATTTAGASAVAATSGTAGVYDFSITTNLAKGDKVTIDGTSYVAGTDFTVGSSASDTATNLAAKISSGTAYTAVASGTAVKLTQTTASATAPTVKVGGSGFNSTLQIGANQGQAFGISINDMRAKSLGISGDAGSAANGITDVGNGTAGSAGAKFVTTNSVTDGTTTTLQEAALDISTHDNATNAIKVLDSAINSVSSERSKLGAYQNRLEHTIANLGTSSENLTSAQSRIADVDMAKEMSTFSKNNILSQAAQAMLAQANQQPQQVLQLLR